MIVIEAALLEELIMHSIVMVSISGGIVIKRKYVKGYRPTFSKIRVVRRALGKLEAHNETSVKTDV